jgi:hypothetical protein
LTSTPEPTTTPTLYFYAGLTGKHFDAAASGHRENVLFAGFIIQEARPNLLIRSAALLLTSFGLPGAMSNPQLELHDANNTIGTNDNWQTTQPWLITR